MDVECFAWTHVCTSSAMPGALRGQKWAKGPLKTESQLFMGQITTLLAIQVLETKHRFFTEASRAASLASSLFNFKNQNSFIFLYFCLFLGVLGTTWYWTSHLAAVFLFPSLSLTSSLLFFPLVGLQTKRCSIQGYGLSCYWTIPMRKEVSFLTPFSAPQMKLPNVASVS